MFKSHLSLTILAVSFASAGAFADIETFGGPQEPIGFEDLRKSCEIAKGDSTKGDAGKGKQVPIKDPTIQCSESVVTWKQVAPGEVSLPGSRRVTAGVYDKFVFVPASAADLAVVAKGGSCTRFAEVEQTMAFEHRTNCDEILSIKGNLIDFCAAILDSKKGGNSKLVEHRDTGHVIDTCGGKGGKAGPK